METETTIGNPLLDYKTEGLKLFKNTKGYNWEIKVIAEKITDETLKRLDEIDFKLRERYGNNEL